MKIAQGAKATGPRVVVSNAEPVAAGPDSLDGFVSESHAPLTVALSRALTAPRGLRHPRVRSAAKWIGVVAATAATTLSGLWAYQQRAVPPTPGALTLQSTPPGLQVSIAGKAVGATPLALSLPAGEYDVVLAAPDGRRRQLSVTLGAGGSVMQHVEMGATSALPAIATTGALRVETDPPGQLVLVDGVRAGTSPVTVTSLTTGRHAVVVRGSRGEVRRTVSVESGETVSLVLSPVQAASAVTAGWLTVDSPVLLQLKENGKVLGTTESERLMLPAGDHELEMTNAALGFRATRRVNVAADQTTTLRVDVPNGTLSINALPWAEVWVGGERVGQTPLANLSRPIGTYEVILRHPQLGERKTTVTVSTTQSARLGVDMRAP